VRQGPTRLLPLHDRTDRHHRDPSKQKSLTGFLIENGGGQQPHLPAHQQTQQHTHPIILRVARRCGASFNSFVQEAQHPRSSPPPPCMSTLPGLVFTARSRENYYITRCSCSWPFLLLPTTGAKPRLPPRRAQGRRQSPTTRRSPSRRSNPTLCCLPADPHPLLAASITRYSDVTLGRLAGDTFGCLLLRPLITPPHMYTNPQLLHLLLPAC
jgi:hypothetical protein